MNIAELKGEKTVKALTKRLLAPQSKGKTAAKTSEAEMEAGLLRLNPQLQKIGRLKHGTTVVVPDNFPLAREESQSPSSSLGEAAMQRMEETLANARATLKEQNARLPAQSSDLKSWLKSDHAKSLSKKTPRLKKVFATAAQAAKDLPNEQAASEATQRKALDAIEKKLAAFRARHALPAARP
jgi:hypothetical protein